MFLIKKAPVVIFFVVVVNLSLTLAASIAKKLAHSTAKQAS